MTSRGNPIRILAIDVGAGTQDVLLYESGQPVENSVKLVVPSQTVVVGRRIATATARGQDIFLVGSLMGGGACARAMRRHIEAGLKVYATEQAAKTFHDDLNRARAMGLVVTEMPPSSAITITTGDVDVPALRRALSEFEVELPKRFAIAVQDHGDCPSGSNREFRFEHLRRFVQSGGKLRDMAYLDAPSYLTRMRAVQFDVPNCVVMDTGPAAVRGALFDPHVAERCEEGIVVVNAGNAHTFGVLVQKQKIWGLFEHHTGDMTSAKLADYVRRLRLGELPNEEVLADGGHGAYVHPEFDASEGFKFVCITGPNRALAHELGFHSAAPFGDMMLTGSFGLVAAALELAGITGELQ